MGGGIENNANSVQLQLQLPTETELGNTNDKVASFYPLLRTNRMIGIIELFIA